MTLSDAKIYVARVIGGALNSEKLDMALEAIKRGFNDWQSEREWEFLLKDTSDGFTVAGVSTTISVATINAPSSGAFDGVNIGVTVTGSNIPASTTVSSYTRSSDGTVASITLSNAPTSTTSVTLTFSGNIPIIAGTDTYNLPTDFNKHYSVRFVGTLMWPLTFVRIRDWDRVTYDQTQRRTSELYTIYNTRSPLTQGKGTLRLKLMGVPASNDTLLVRYYRKFDVTADPIDITDDFLYPFLDYCRSLLLQTKRSFDDPSAFLADVNNRLQKAMTDDQEVTEDEDVHMKTQMEMWAENRPLFGNGPYWPLYGGY